MNQNELVEAIIKEVKRVLAMRGIQVSSSPEGSTAATPSAVSSTPVVSAHDVIDQSVGSRDSTGKQVITQRDLEALQGQSITVTPRAVITPLAHDYAREKGITITRVAGTGVQDGGSVSPQPVAAVGIVIAPDFPSDSTIVKKFLASRGLQVKEFSGKSYEAAIANLTGAVSSGTANFGVCVEKSGMEGTIHANRNKSIRAVHCRDTMEARAARVDIGANIIVLDAVSNPEAVIGGYIGV